MRFMPLSLRVQRVLVPALRWVRTRILLPLAQRCAELEQGGAKKVREDHDRARLRLAVCERCPLYSGGFCSRAKGGCGCFMPLKAQLSNATCPKGHW